MSRRDHEARARAVFGDELYPFLRVVAAQVRVRCVAEEARDEAEAQRNDVLLVADEIEHAIKISRRRMAAPWSSHLELRAEWARINDLLATARKDLEGMGSRCVALLGRPYVAGHYGPRPRGRPDSGGRARFVREGLALLERRASVSRPIKTPDAGDWADLGFWVGIERDGGRFEHVRKAYADLLEKHAPAPAPGKTRRPTISRAREKRRKG